MHANKSLGYFATAEEAALTHARHTAPAKEARAVAAAAKASAAARREAQVSAKATQRAQRQAEAEAKVQVEAEAQRAADEARRKRNAEWYGDSETAREAIIQLAKEKNLNRESRTELELQVADADPACLPSIFGSIRELPAQDERAELPVHRCPRCAPRCRYLGHVLCNDRCWPPNGLHFLSVEWDPDGASRRHMLAQAMHVLPTAVPGRHQ